MTYVKNLRKIIGGVLPTSSKSRLRELLNAFYPDETIEESKKKWKKIGKENNKHVVIAGFGKNITEEQFSETGKNHCETLIKNDPFFRKLNPLNNKRILEIGCGTGRITGFIAENFQEVRGIDISEEMIEQAKNHLAGKTNIHLYATDGLHMPFPDAFFDAVFSFIVFQHMPNRQTVKKNLEETARVLKIGGLAKIQLRGLPVPKRKWFYGPSFTIQEVNKMIENFPIRVLKSEGAGTKYFWVWLQKL